MSLNLRVVLGFVTLLLGLRIGYEFFHPAHPSAAFLASHMSPKDISRVELRGDAGQYETRDPDLIRQAWNEATHARAGYNMLEQLATTRNSATFTFFSDKEPHKIDFDFSERYAEVDCGKSFAVFFKEFERRATNTSPWLEEKRRADAQAAFAGR